DAVQRAVPPHPEAEGETEDDEREGNEGERGLGVEIDEQLLGVVTAVPQVGDQPPQLAEVHLLRLLPFLDEESLVLRKVELLLREALEHLSVRSEFAHPAIAQLPPGGASDGAAGIEPPAHVE